MRGGRVSRVQSAEYNIITYSVFLFCLMCLILKTFKYFVVGCSFACENKEKVHG